MINPEEMRYNSLKDIVQGKLSTPKEKEAAAFELTVRNIQKSSVSDGVIQIKNLMESARRGVNIESTAAIVDEAIKRESRNWETERQSLLLPLNKARKELSDMIYAEDEKQAATYTESAFYELIDDALNHNPMLAVEVGYNRIASWVVTIYDAKGTTLTEAPRIISIDNNCRLLAMYQAAKKIRELLEGMSHGR